MPDCITELGSGAFKGCKSLKSVKIPNGVTTISHWVFEDCEELTSIVIPGNVTYICSDAFKDCTKLISITIPESVTSIGFGAFSGCSNYTIYGYVGTTAQQYAVDNDIPFVLLERPEFVFSSLTVSNNLVSGIAAGNTVGQVFAKCSNEPEKLKVFNANGAQVTNTSARMGTGFVIKLYDASGTLADEVTAVVKGDLNGDGKVEATDARLALRAATSLENLTSAQNAAGAVSGGAKPTATDARTILRVATNLESF
jgi:hypothetical protein